MFEALIKDVAKFQALKTTGQLYAIKALIEIISESQALQVAGQVHTV